MPKPGGSLAGVEVRAPRATTAEVVGDDALAFIAELSRGFAPRIDEATWLFTPAIVLLAGCVPSLVFAVLTVRPRLNRTPITVEQVRANAGNLLFFGQFSGMPLAEFNESMHTLIDNPRLLQDSLIRQLWLMGQSLKQKYRFLQIAYALFLVGVGGAGIVLVVQLVTRYGGSAPL